MGEAVWIESKTEEVLSNLVSLKKCLMGGGGGDVSSNRMSVLESLKSWLCILKD